MINHNVPDATLSRFKTAVAAIISEEYNLGGSLLLPDDPRLARHPLWIAVNAIMVANDPFFDMKESRELIKKAKEEITDAGYPDPDHYIRMAQQLFDVYKANRSGNPIAADIFNRSVKAAEEDDNAIAEFFRGIVSKLRLVFCHPDKAIYRSWRDYGNGDIKFGTVGWRLPSKIRIALLADWGTGTEEATNVLKAAVARKPDIIVHLGDIYDTGSEEECEEKFARPMRDSAPDIPVYTLAGNHDYYCGGEGFYKLIDRLNSGDKRQQASYFALRTEGDEWQLLAMDTGWDSFRDKGDAHDRGPGLHPDEILWLRDKLMVFPGKTILLSHHQPFSNVDTMYGDYDDPEESQADRINRRLIDAVGDYMERVTIWAVGHEHRTMIYEDVNTLAKFPVRLRCVGNSAKGDSVKKETKKRKEIKKHAQIFPYREDVLPSVTQNGEEYNRCFEIIDLNHSAATVCYYEATEKGRSRLLYKERI